MIMFEVLTEIQKMSLNTFLLPQAIVLLLAFSKWVGSLSVEAKMGIHSNVNVVIKQSKNYCIFGSTS